MKILVTGATGQSGAAVVREFAQHQVPVRILVRDRAKAAPFESFRTVQITEGDMLRPETLADALQGIERVLMISSAYPNMIETQRSFIDAAKKRSVQHIVKFSGKESNIGYDSSKFRFGRMHEEIEHYLENSGLSWTHLRPSQFMQVYLREAPSIAKKGELCLPLENVRMSPVDQKDIAKVAFALLTTDRHEGKTYEMTGPEALSMDEIAERISDAIGKKVVYRNITPAERRNALLQTGMPTDFVDALDEQGEERRRCPESQVNVATHQMFGVRPTTFAEFAREHAAIFRSNGLQH